MLPSLLGTLLVFHMWLPAGHSPAGSPASRRPPSQSPQRESFSHFLSTCSPLAFQEVVKGRASTPAPEGTAEQVFSEIQQGCPPLYEGVAGHFLHFCPAVDFFLYHQVSWGCPGRGPAQGCLKRWAARSSTTTGLFLGSSGAWAAQLAKE